MIGIVSGFRPGGAHYDKNTAINAIYRALETFLTPNSP
jgi:hypothetical protein